MRLIRTEINAIAAVGVLAQMLTVISGPLVARMLGPEGRGTLFLVMVVATIGAQIGSASLSTAISHVVARAGGNARDALGSDVGTWFVWSLVPAAVAGVASVFLLGDAPLLLLLGFETFLVTLFACWLNVLHGMLQGERAVRLLNVQRIIFNVTYVGAVVTIFVVRQSDLAAVILVPFLLAQVVGLLMGRAALRQPTGDPSARVGRSAVHRFARHAFVSSVGTLSTFGLDALILGMMLSRAEVGLYAVAASVTTVPAMALGGIAAALLPRMASAQAGYSATIMRRWLLGAALVDVVLVIGLQVVIDPAIRIFFGAEFVPAITCARILIIAWGLLALRLVLAAGVQGQNRAGRASAIELGSSAVLVVAVVVGIQRGGIEGAALALLFTAALSCVCLGLSLSWRAAPDRSTVSSGSTP